MSVHDRVYAEDFPDMTDWDEDYATYLKSYGRESGCRLVTADIEKQCSDVFPLPEGYHEDQFVGRMACR